MKYFLCTSFTLSLLLAGCSQGVMNEEPIENSTEEITETEINVDLEDANKNENSPAVQETLIGIDEVELPDEGADDEEPIEEFKDGKLTEEGAIHKVKEFLDIQSSDDVHIVIDREEDGKYIVQVFDVIGDEVGHTMTRGWYTVDTKTGEVEEML